MGTNLNITAAAILTTLALTGCTVGEPPTATNTAIPTASPQATAQSKTQPQSVTQPFNNPVVSTKPSVNPGAVASLIQPTNSTERLIVLQKGRTDPFGQILEPIFPQNTTLGSGKISVPKLPPLPTASQPQPIGTTTIKPIRTTAIKPPTALPKKTMQIAQKPKPVLPTVLAGSVTSPQLKTELPPVPQPVTARAVIVTGVVLIGKVPQAIIKVPDEPTSRYVQPGQRLVNGVLVKRIEMNQGVSPTVILEQYGIEVAKQVGEQPTKESKPATTASLGNGISVVSPQENLVGAS
jgi:hypothetical protein